MANPVVTVGTTVETGGSAYAASLNVSTPSLAAGDAHYIFVTTVVGGTPVGDPFPTAPTNYTILGAISGALFSTTNAFMHVFYRIATGTVSSGTATLTMSSSQTGKISAIPAKVTGSDTSATPQVATNDSSLAAPSLSPAVAGSELVSFFGIRDTVALTVTPPSGMTEVAEKVTTTSNNTTQVTGELATLDLVGITATGTKTATASAGTGPKGSISIVIPPGTGGSGGGGGSGVVSTTSPGIAATTGGVNTQGITLTAPAISATQAHVIFAAISMSSAAITTPTGYTILQSTSMSSSTGAQMYCYYRLGAASSGTVSLTNNPTTTLGHTTAVHCVIDNIDPANPFDLFTQSGTTLNAPSLNLTTAGLLLTAYAVREGDNGTGTFTITKDSSMTEVAESLTTVTNGTTQVDIELDSLAIAAAGATGVKTATTTAGAGVTVLRSVASMSIGVNPGSAVASAPNAPVLTATAGDTQVVLNWSAPANNGSTITGYTLQRSTTSGSGFSTITSPTAGATSYTDTGRTNGTAYFYKLSATNGVGTSSYSAEVTATPAAAASTGYMAVVMATNPPHYYPLNGTYTTQDLGNAASLVNFITDIQQTGGGPTPAAITGPPTFGSQTLNGSTINCAKFVVGQSLRLATNNQDFSVTKTKEITIMIHLAVDDYDTGVSNGEYKHPLHKGESLQHEWMIRTYNASGGPQARPRRHSGYYFNPSGGTGDGSYCQPDMAPAVTAERNMIGKVGSTGGVAETNLGVEHVIIVQYWTTQAVFPNASFPGGIKIFFNGVQIDTDSMTSGNNILPTFTTQNVRLGRQDFHDGWFVGRARRVGFWNRLLTQAEITSLSSATNMALTEGTKNSTPVEPPPTQPLNFQGTRGASSGQITFTWTPPNTVGNGLTKYNLTHDNGGVGSSVASGDLGPSVLSYVVNGVPNVTVNATITATNAAGTSSPASTSVVAAATLPLIGTLSDNFDAAVDSRRVFDSGVVQLHNRLEWTAIDTTPRGSYVRGDMRGQDASFTLAPDQQGNVVTSFYVRSTADLTKQVRIAYLNGTLTARFDNGSVDASPAVRAYVPSADVFWRINSDGTNVTLETSQDGSTYTSIGRLAFAEPTWFNDVRVGVEAYTSTSI